MRKEIQEFAEAMENKMSTHDKDRIDEWQNFEFRQLWTRLNQEIDEWKITENVDELIDIANFCMMIWNKYGKHSLIKVEKKGEV